MDDTVKNLEEIGLPKKEAEIYLAVLQLGKATIVDIGRKSKIKRTTVYEHLDDLLAKGLVYKTAEKKRIYYCAENPEKISKILDKRKKHFEKILPELKNVYAVARHKPQVRFYEGKEGMRAIYDEMTKTAQTIYGTFSAEKYFSIFGENDNEDFFQNIRESGGQIKDLVENSPAGKRHTKGKFYENVGTPKMLPADFNLSVDLMVAGDKVAMISLVNLIGIVIENFEIAELQRNFIKFMRANV
jgi:sugar-specific transcriptional regulator TrmB